MDEERAIKLESIPGWSWEPLEDNWEAKYQELLAYVKKEDKIPSRSDPNCGFWVNTQRSAYKSWKEPEKYKPVRICMDEERAAKLESIPGWSWEPQEDAWAEKYQELLEYVEKHNKIPSRSHPTLGFWVRDQRQAYRAWKEPEKYKSVNRYMDEERAAKLESIPGWKWDMSGRRKTFKPMR